MMSMGGGYNPQNKYPSYNGPPYEQQQQAMNDYRRPSSWNGPPHGAPGEPRNFGNRPNFMDRPTGPPNNWNQNHQKDGPRPNRDPRMQRNEPQPPVNSAPPVHRPVSPPKAPQVAKEVHPKKLNKQNENGEIIDC